ncbi:MAG: M20/M25/M40 family metallo-hydrolase, partial [Anaerolineae bacterium]|nr:M20/M25/M40 family metallo-hydrolase [Anaerolineae bacterium]
QLQRYTERILSIFAQQPVPDVTFKVTFEDVHPPMPRTEPVAQLEQLTIALAHQLGFEVKGTSTGGAADAAFAAAEGVPVLDGLGPIGGLDHSPDEYILKSSIVPRTALLAHLIMAIAKRETT